MPLVSTSPFILAQGGVLGGIQAGCRRLWDKLIFFSLPKPFPVSLFQAPFLWGDALMPLSDQSPCWCVLVLLASHM